MQDSTFPHELHVHLQCIVAEVLFIFVRSSQFYLQDELFVFISNILIYTEDWGCGCCGGGWGIRYGVYLQCFRKRSYLWTQCCFCNSWNVLFFIALAMSFFKAIDKFIWHILERLQTTKIYFKTILPDRNTIWRSINDD